MKQLIKPFILAFSLLLTLQGNAQSWGLIEEVPSSFSTDGGIVRYWKDSIFVSCNRDIQGNYVFSLIQKNSPTCFQTWNSQDYLSISDFQIYKDEVFLCGEANTTDEQMSFFGRFNINDLFSAPVNFESMKFPNNNLSKMVVYKESSGVHIVAIGSEANSQPQRGKLVECHYDDQHGFNGLTCYSAGVNYQAPRFKDIVVTNKYVVVVAEDWKICLYRCPKNDIASGITSYEYQYPTAYSEPSMNLPATAMYDDVIATSCYALSSTLNNWQNNIRLFDINTMDMIDAQSILEPNKGNSHDIVYLPFDRSLVVSHLRPVDDETEFATEIIHVIPFMASIYAADRIVIDEPTWFFDGLEVAEDRFVISGYANKWFVNDMSSTAGTCSVLSSETIKPIIVNPTHISPSPYLPEAPTPYHNSRSVNARITPVSILCNQSNQ